MILARVSLPRHSRIHTSNRIYIRDRRWLSIHDPGSSVSKRKRARGSEAKRLQLLPKSLEDDLIQREKSFLPPNCDPIWLVFDVNGTLASKTKARKLREKQNVNQRLWLRPRPYVGPLLQQLDESGHFRLALWSSARPSNVQKSVNLLELLSNVKFERVLSREHSIPAPTPENKYATVKHLQGQGFDDLSRVVLIDDEKSKAYVGEEANHLYVPPWEENNDDRVLVRLTEALLRVLPGVEDVREYTKEISEALKGFERSDDDW